MTFPVVFVGATRLGLRCLDEMLRMPAIDVVGVVTAPRWFRISYRPEGVHNVLHADFDPLASQAGIPLALVEGKMSDPALLARVRAWSPKLIVVAGWYHLIPRAMREIAPAVGLHASLLPDYSGGAPLVWAMINGEKETGITLFQLDDGMDTGPIVGQLREPIHEDDTIATLYARIEERTLELLRLHLPSIARGEARYTPQDESRRRVFPQRSPEDGRIDWSWPARRIYDFVRAQTRPYPGAYAELQGRRVTVWSAKVKDFLGDPATSAGTVLGVDEDPRYLLIACGYGSTLALMEISVDGADRYAGDWYRALEASASSDVPW